MWNKKIIKFFFYSFAHALAISLSEIEDKWVQATYKLLRTTVPTLTCSAKSGGIEVNQIP